MGIEVTSCSVPSRDADFFAPKRFEIACLSRRKAGYALHRCLNLRFRDGIDWHSCGDSSGVPRDFWLCGCSHLSDAGWRMPSILAPDWMDLPNKSGARRTGCRRVLSMRWCRHQTASFGLEPKEAWRDSMGINFGSSTARTRRGWRATIFAAFSKTGWERFGLVQIGRAHV